MVSPYFDRFSRKIHNMLLVSVENRSWNTASLLLQKHSSIQKSAT